MNIVLAILALALVVAVGVAVNMAGRIRKQEAAQRAAENTATASESASEEKASGEKKEALTAADAAGTGTEDPVGENPADDQGTDAAGAGTGDSDGEDLAGSQETDAAGAGTEDAADGAPAGKMVHVEVNGEVVMECPLTNEARYVIVDGTAVLLDKDITLKDLESIGDPENHDVNFIYVHDGKVSCTESNCDNQVCVATGEITGSAFDLPIICLPHGLVVEVIG